MGNTTPTNNYTRGSGLGGQKQNMYESADRLSSWRHLISWSKGGQPHPKAIPVVFILWRNSLQEGICLTPTKMYNPRGGAQNFKRHTWGGVWGAYRVRSLAAKALWIGYYWLTLWTNAIEMVRKCDKCPRFAHVHHQPSTPLTTMHSPLPFATWGMDILGPFPKATGQHKFLLVAVDYFTMWVKAEAVASITKREVRKFI